MNIKDIKETFHFQSGKIDRENLRISDVAILGSRISSNGRYYSDKSLASLARLSEGVRSFDRHSEEHGLNDLLGFFEQVKVVDSAVKGTLNILESSERGKILLEIAEKQPSLASFSISARAEFSGFNEDGLEIVSDIKKLYSADCLCVEAGTTVSVFEGSSDGLAKVNESLVIRNVELQERNDELLDKIKSLEDENHTLQGLINWHREKNYRHGVEKNPDSEKKEVSFEQARKLIEEAMMAKKLF